MICVNCAALKTENAALRDDLAKLSEEYERAMRVVAAAQYYYDNMWRAGLDELLKESKGEGRWNKFVEALEAARGADE